MGTTSPGFARGMFAPRTAVAARATGGPSARLPAASCSGAVCLGLCRRRCWVGGFDEGPFGVCSVGLLIARPVSPLGYGMICPHDASCTMSADVLCHNPPGPARGHGLLAQAHTSGCSHGRWWINRSALSKRPSGWFFRHRTVRTGHLTLT